MSAKEVVPMAEAADIFLSHAHEDNAWCRTFVEALRQGGATVWYDEHSLGYGVLGEEIERELLARPIFIVILSPASVNSPWVRLEVDAAIHLRDQNPERILLPVVAEKAEVPLIWQEFKRVSGPGDTGIGAPEAASQVIQRLGIVTANATAAPAPPVQTETAEEANARGDVLAELQRYEEALALDPQHAATWNNKGNALAELQRYEESLSAYEQALALDPQDADAWDNKIAVLEDLGRSAEVQEAERQRDEALRHG
jgi:tetratricopeptide (TPR) repeat protein